MAQQRTEMTEFQKREWTRRVSEITQPEEHKERKNQKNKQSLRDL